MSDVKKYYWLKLKSDFFDDDTIQYIEEQENGVQYVNFYLKLCLKSLKNDGKLIRYIGNTLLPYNDKTLAKLTNTDIDTVKKAMDLFKNIGLVELLETGEIYLSQINEMIGSETDKAVMMRKKRIKENALGNNVTQQSNNVTQQSNNVTQVLPKCYLEIEKEIEKEKELEGDINISSSPPPIISKTNDEILNNEFEKLWELYPKKVGKPKALQKYKKYRKSKKDDYCTFDDVMNGLERYLKYIEQNEWYSPKNGDTWFNNQSWKDEYIINEVDENQVSIFDRDEEVDYNNYDECETIEETNMSDEKLRELLKSL